MQHEAKLEKQPSRASYCEWLWGALVVAVFLSWSTSLCPGLFLSDSFAVLGKIESGAYDGAFSYLYQLPLRLLYTAGLSIRAVAVTAFIVQLASFYGLVFWIGRYLLNSFRHPLAWVPLGLTLFNPVFPVMYSLHTVNTAANLLFVCFAFLNYRLLRCEMRPYRSAVVIIVLGAMLVALRLDMLPSVFLSFLALLLVNDRGRSYRRSATLASVMMAALLLFNVAIPRLLDFRPAFTTYLLTLIYRPLDKLLASDPALLDDPAVTEPIEAIIRMPASRIIGHGEEVFWWDIDRRPSPEVSWSQLAVFLRLGTERLHVLVGDRASLLVELLGSTRSFFFGDIALQNNTPFEANAIRWGLREAQFPHSTWVKAQLPRLQSSWSPAEPRYWLWNQLPYFILLSGIACLYPFVPATSFMVFLVVLRLLVLAVAAPYGFYFYSTSVYLAGLLLAIPLAWLERRRPNIRLQK